MKIIKLKKLKNFDYKEALLGLLGNAPENGYTVNDVRMATKAMNVIERAKKEAELEDAVYNFVKKRINESKYKMAAPELVEFIDDMNRAEEKKAK